MQPAAQTEKPAIAFTTPYQAVFLSNNSVYFGKLSDDGTFKPGPPTTKQVQNVVAKHGKELHGSDLIYRNANSIIFVKPVDTDSRVRQLIQEANQQI